MLAPQRGLWSRNSVRLSVRHTRALWLIQRTYWGYFYTIWKGNPSSFLPPNSGWWATSLSTQNGRWKWPTRLWKSLMSTDYNEFTRWRHSARFWRHHNSISYLLWRWPLLSFHAGFSYIVRIIIMWRFMHCVEISFLNSDCLLTSSVIQNTCIWWPHWYQNRWPCTVYDRWPAIFSVGCFGLSSFLCAMHTA